MAGHIDKFFATPAFIIFDAVPDQDQSPGARPILGFVIKLRHFGAFHFCWNPVQIPSDEALNSNTQLGCHHVGKFQFIPQIQKLWQAKA